MKPQYRTLCPWAMVCLLATAAAGLAACSEDPQEICEQRPGRELYAEACASCHGAEGQREAVDLAAPGPGLAGVGLKRFWRHLTLEGSRGRYGPTSSMTAFSATGLELADLDAILDFVVDGSPRGERLYSAACATCHGTAESPGSGAPGLFGPRLLEQWARTLPDRASAADGPSMPLFPYCAEDNQALMRHLGELQVRQTQGGTP